MVTIMGNAIEIIGIGWLSYLCVSFYVQRALRKKLPLRKPFSCEKCLSFWLSFPYFLITTNDILKSVIFASLTSLTTTLMVGLSNTLNK